MKSKLLSFALLASLLAPTGCDAPEAADSIDREQLSNVELGVERLGVELSEEVDPADLEHDLDLGISVDPAEGFMLCCGHGSYTWNCGGDSDRDGVWDAYECTKSLYCEVGACDGSGLGT